ncbi:MAG: RNA methyltransferase [Candidatus Symbiothrix sp.]|nr:RNA methyltransferase [Candidatus Symbiothrix sp.]
MEVISSLQNSRIKNILKLIAKTRERREQGLFVIEGAREIGLALSGQYAPESVFVCPALFAKSNYPELLSKLPPTVQPTEVSEAVFGKLAYREGSDGVLALARPKSHRLQDLQLSAKAFIIVLETVEKPGNLGAILRTADAAHADAVIVCDPSTDIYNPNVVRSSVGCLFTVQVATASNAETLAFLHDRQIRSFAAELQATKSCYQADFTQASAIIMGTESDGLTDFWLKNADERIIIPMRGTVDSLNVSVSTAILTFEAMRQRGLTTLQN